MAPKKEWMLGLPGHTDLVSFEDLQRLISGGQLRDTDMVKKIGDPWRSAGEIPELRELFLRPVHPPKDPPRPTTWVPKSEPQARSETARVAKTGAAAPAPRPPSPAPSTAPRRPEGGAAKPPPPGRSPESQGPAPVPPREKQAEKKAPPTIPPTREDAKSPAPAIPAAPSPPGKKTEARPPAAGSAAALPPPAKRAEAKTPAAGVPSSPPPPGKADLKAPVSLASVSSAPPARKTETKTLPVRTPAPPPPEKKEETRFPASGAPAPMPPPARGQEGRAPVAASPASRPPPAAMEEAGTGTSGGASPIPQVPAEAEEPQSPVASSPAESSRPDSTRIEKPPGEPRAPRRPRRPDLPRLEPMAPKYFSPVDLLRSASHSFDPRKLFVAAGALVPLMIFWSLLDLLRQGCPNTWMRLGIFLFSMAGLVFGLAVVWTALAYATRRQLEGIPYRVAEVVVYGVRNLATAFVYPLLVLIPSLLALAALWILGILRDLNPGLAAALKILFIVPLFFALLAMVGVVGYQLASMYVPSAAAVEGAGIGGAVRAAWGHIRHQMGRMVLHWLIVTVATGVITIVGLGLMEMALRLPDWVFGVPRDAVSLQAYERWREFEGLFSVYRGLAYGLGLTLPVSLLSTLGVLSYLTLRHPVSAPLPGPLEETGSIGLGRVAGPADTWPAGRAGSGNGPAPGETRPAPPVVADDVSDDSDEQPLA